jgi:hypothetical protein
MALGNLHVSNYSFFILLLVFSSWQEELLAKKVYIRNLMKILKCFLKLFVIKFYNHSWNKIRQELSRTWKDGLCIYYFIVSQSQHNSSILLQLLPFAREVLQLAVRTNLSYIAFCEHFFPFFFWHLAFTMYSLGSRWTKGLGKSVNFPLFTFGQL